MIVLDKMNVKKRRDKNIVSFVVVFLVMFCSEAFCSVQNPVAIDSRVKTLVYSPNEIFQLKFAVGYQSIVQLEDNEEVELLAFGDPVPWSIKVVGPRIFIKAMDPGIKTNMMILTNKRSYMTEIFSTDADEDQDSLDDQVIYLAKFFYPEVIVDSPKKFKMKAPNIDFALPANGEEQEIQGSEGFNYAYTFAGTSTSILPLRVFDDGTKTYMLFPNNNEVVPGIHAVDFKGREKRLKVYLKDDYVVVDTIEYQFALRWGKELICVFNESLLASSDVGILYE